MSDRDLEIMTHTGFEILEDRQTMSAPRLRVSGTWALCCTPGSEEEACWHPFRKAQHRHSYLPGPKGRAPLEGRLGVVLLRKKGDGQELGSNLPHKER